MDLKAVVVKKTADINECFGLLLCAVKIQQARIYVKPRPKVNISYLVKAETIGQEYQVQCM